MRRVFLENLPKKKFGKKENIDWERSIGMTIKFVFDDIKGEFLICESDKKNKIGLIYLGKYYEIKKESVIHCMISNIVNKRIVGFLYNVGDNIKTDHIDITILEKYYNKNYKYYKFKCNICGWEDGRIDESHIKSRKKCGCCSNQVVVEGINDIPTTDSWMIKFFQGGYDEAKQYTKGSGKKINPICSDCGKIKPNKIKISTISENMSIGCSCSDRRSYPEKFVTELLKQLNIEFETEKRFEWANNKKYDFYIPEYNMIIEVHGGQHYEKSSRGRTLEEEQYNDKYKKCLALNNNIDSYIVIDARKSNLEWIKNSIIKSKLSSIFNLSNVNWSKCSEMGTTNLIKVASDIKRNNPEMTTTQIGKIIGRSTESVSKYLKVGTEMGWCDYIPKNDSKLVGSKNGKMSRSKSIDVYKDGVFLGTVSSGKELDRVSLDRFGVKLIGRNAIKSYKDGKMYKGYEFKVFNN